MSDASSVEVATHLLSNAVTILDADTSKITVLRQLFDHLRNETHVLLLRPSIIGDMTPLFASADEKVRTSMIEFNEEVVYRMQGLGDLKWQSEFPKRD